MMRGERRVNTHIHTHEYIQFQLYSMNFENFQFSTIIVLYIDWGKYETIDESTNDK